MIAGFWSMLGPEREANVRLRAWTRLNGGTMRMEWSGGFGLTLWTTRRRCNAVLR